MKKLLVGSVGLIGFMASTAMAADMGTPVYKAPPAPPVAADIWNGFYGGFNAGGIVGRDPTNDALTTQNALTLVPVIGDDTYKHAPFGGVFGAQLGWNWHAAPSFVLGLEGDAQWSHATDTACIDACLPAAGFGPGVLLSVTDEQSLKWFATARARAGWLTPGGTLWYATGGAAWTQVDETVTLAATPTFFNVGTSSAGSFSHDKMGWTLGAGVETPFAPHWTLKAEYLYADFGHVSDSFTSLLGGTFPTGSTATMTYTSSLREQIARIGVNYHLGEGTGAMASAAPIYKAPAAAPARWNGFYAGLNGGGSLARDRTTDTSVVPGVAPPTFGADNFSHAPIGGIVGGQIGVNWQAAPAWVLGFETDMQWSGERDTACISACLPTGAAGNLLGLTNDQELKWFGTARARFGWVAPNGSLLYATGGAAWGRVEDTLTMFATPTFFATGNSAGASFSGDKTGWTVGAGIETPFGRRWSFKAEYLYVDLGSISDTFSAPLDPGVGGPTITTTTSSTIRDHIVRLGLNYHLN